MSDYILIMGGILFNDVDRNDELIGLTIDEVNNHVSNNIDEYSEDQISIHEFKPKRIKLILATRAVLDHVEIKD